MLNKRLMALLGTARRYIYGHVACQWGMLLCNIAIILSLAYALALALEGRVPSLWLWALMAASVALRHALAIQAARLSARATAPVKQALRTQLYAKLTRLGAAYHERVSTADAVQVATEGVEQLETYFGVFLPQLFYSVAAPLTLFAFMAAIHLPTAILLLVIVPMIPIAIVAIQRRAKSVQRRYWGQYAQLGDSFLESLMGLTTLKIYQADGAQAREMARQSERFRGATMQVLTMQLSSIIVMDVIAYGGAAAGLIAALLGYRAGATQLWGCLAIILLAAEFFLPLRALGSYFHTAMNGMAASERLFAMLDLDEPGQGTRSLSQGHDLSLSGLSFSYDGSREVLRDIHMEIPPGGFVSIVGASGSGKSTLAAILTGRCRGYSGSASIGGIPLEAVREADLMAAITRIDHNSYLFSGTVEEALRLGNGSASEDQLWQSLERVNLADFLRAEAGLSTHIAEGGSNLSGGQRQRLALARGLLHDSPVYIFDEATSNIDVESENDIAAIIRGLAGSKTVVMISHRLANVVASDAIYVLESGQIAGVGTHQQLLAACRPYRALWETQQELERYGAQI